MLPDYAGQNLRGRSFKGQNLEGANFSKADIRGANFTDAILKGADFTGAKAGLQRRWVILLLIVTLVLLALAGIYLVSFGLSVASSIFDTKYPGSVLMGSVYLILVGVFCIVTVRKGITTGLKSLAVTLVITSLIVLTVAVAFPGTFLRTRTSSRGLVFAFALVFALVLILFSIFIGWRIQGKHDKDDWLNSFANIFAATGGTSFHGANLINADFTGAILQNTDFRKADLKRTRFYEAKKLEFARVDGTILANRAVLDLLVTCNGRGKSYAAANLRGANLKGADLSNANLKGADIIVATFEGACLEWANLTITQAVYADFTDAQMTGACIEAWNIDSSTQLNNVDCRFVYLLEYPKLGTDDRERRPSSGEFQPGEFTKLFEEVLNTVDLIFRDGIDWKAFVNAFQILRDENKDAELYLQRIENKDGVFVIRVKVSDGADKEKIHSDFTQNYQLALQAVEEKYKAQLQAKDNEIVIYRQQSADMKEIVSLLANKQINVKVDNKLENKNMTNSNDYSRKFENSGTFNNSGQINLGEISGTVTNTINELPSSPEPDKPEVKELLAQLQAAIEAEKDLPEEDKAEALEQVKTLAEAGKNPQEGAMQKAAKTAVKILKGTVASLPSATKLVEECSKLLPLISQLLGLG
ncbi:MAG TPA: pentapeptide repeat-containing protein [Nodularia sp. (in: cyanobacteria)]|nr:pentapeptide repeat-containing protein [Nodularia sp. (in: cyanobacteria)]